MVPCLSAGHGDAPTFPSHLHAVLTLTRKLALAFEQARGLLLQPRRLAARCRAGEGVALQPESAQKRDGAGPATKGVDQEGTVVRRPQVARCKSSPLRPRSTSPTHADVCTLTFEADSPIYGSHKRSFLRQVTASPRHPSCCDPRERNQLGDHRHRPKRVVTIREVCGLGDESPTGPIEGG
jgi:hypothetical protein